MKRIYTAMLAMVLSFSIFTGCSAQRAVPSAQVPDASEQPESAAKEANWVIEINDTQQITDDEGLIWNYTLTMHASKSGGTDVLGSYIGDIVLLMEPDMDSAKALAAREGADLLSMLFKHHSEADNVSFDLTAYSPEARSQQMASAAPDNPLLQVNVPGASADALAVVPVTFEATQEPVSMTVSDGETTASSTFGGGKTTVTVPVEFTVDGANISCFIYETVHPLSRAFEGVITGDVIK